MFRIRVPERDNWPTVIQDDGLTFLDLKTTDLKTGEEIVVRYPHEGRAIGLTDEENGILGDAASTIFEALSKFTEKMLQIEAIAHGNGYAGHERECFFRKLRIPEIFVPGILRTWQLDRVITDPVTGETRWAENIAPERFPHLWGRFDIVPVLHPRTRKIIGAKGMEFNCDTPTGALETAVLQDKQFEFNKAWLTERYGEVAQWNLLWEEARDQWIRELTEFRNRTGRLPAVIHIACTGEEEYGEERMTVEIVGSAAEAAARKLSTGAAPAFRVKYIELDAINRRAEHNSDGTVKIVSDGIFADTIVGTFTDSDPAFGGLDEHGKPIGEPIEMAYLLLPWEALLDPEQTTMGFEKTLLHNLATAEHPIVWVEPVWKLLWSNKAIWALMWEEYKDVPEVSQYLLETHFVNDPELPQRFRERIDCVLKPIWGREGADTKVYGPDGQLLGAGVEQGYGEEGFVLQQRVDLPTFVDHEHGTMYVVAGVWVVGDKVVAILFREDRYPVTTDQAFFVMCFTIDLEERAA